MTGSWIALGNENAVSTCFVQISGEALRIKLPAFQTLIEEIPVFRSHCLRSVAEIVTQTSETALANAKSNLQQRVARWLMLAAKSLGSDSIPMTHEFLSMLLGARRAGVTVALQALARDGVVQNTRAMLVVLDRTRLEEIAHAWKRLPSAPVSGG